MTFTEFVEKYKNYIYYLCIKDFRRNGLEGDDKYQECLIVLYRKFDTFDWVNYPDPTGYISDICNKTLSNYFSKHTTDKYNYMKHSFSLDSETGSEYLETNQHLYLEEEDYSMDILNLTSSIRNSKVFISDKNREIYLTILNYLVSGYSQRETAEILGINLKALETKLHKAKYYFLEYGLEY